MTTLLAIQNEVMEPAGIATVSPFTDTDPARKLKHRNARKCSMFTCRAFSRFAEYLSNAQVLEGHGDSTVASPVDADLSSLPPVTIHASSDELLVADAELMAKRLEASGIHCDLHLWDGQIHDFPLAADVLPEAGARSSTSAISSRTSPPPGPDSRTCADCAPRRPVEEPESSCAAT